jgi:hypothetical protein
MKEQKLKSEIWVLEAGSENVTSLVISLKKRITEHFKQNGRVKIIHSDGSPPQELLPDFTFDNWKN